MIGSVRAELLRLTRWPVTWVVTGVWLALNVMFGYVFDLLGYRDAVSSGDRRLAAELLAQISPAGVPATMTQGLPLFGGALVLVLAAVSTGNGYGWNTWKTVFTQGPPRLAAFGGTMAALAVVLVGIVVLSLVVDLAASAVVMTAESQALTWPTIGELAEGVGGALLIAGMWAAAGAMLGIVAKGPALSAGLGLIWVLVVENLLRGVSGLLGALEPVTDYLPGTAAGSLAAAIGGVTGSESGGAPGVVTILTGPSAATLLTGYAVVFMLVAGFLMARRDA
ncbi:MAG: ABC transporter permease [Micromonosporaceae bacterium]|nr:ABC transporter permease [Micromonosporaceae bacterium]